METSKKSRLIRKSTGNSSAMSRAAKIVTIASSSHISSIEIRETSERLYFYSAQSTAVFVRESYEFPLHIEKIFSVAKDAIKALLDNRDFLGYQLSYAKGNINDDQMDELASLYLAEVPFNMAELVEKSIILAWLIPEQIDADIIATIFKCEDVQAQEILEQARSKMQLPEYASPCEALPDQAH